MNCKKISRIMAKAFSSCFSSCLDFIIVEKVIRKKNVFINNKVLFIIFQVILCEECKENGNSCLPH